MSFSIDEEYQKIHEWKCERWRFLFCLSTQRKDSTAAYCEASFQTLPSSSLDQRFSIPVLAPPRSAYFVCYSYRFRCLFYWNVSALRSGHHRIFLHDSSSKRTYIFHSKCTEVCKTLCREQWTLCREQWTLCREQWTLCREQWTLCREQWTLCREQWTLCREQWTLCREQWTLCREQWTLCREHVNRNTVHARSALLTSWLSGSGVLTKRDMQNMQSGGGERTGIENLCFR